LLQTDHFAPDQVAEDRPEALPLAPLNFVHTEVSRTVFDARAVPLSQERLLGAPRFAPAHAVPHGRMTGRHRLVVDPAVLAQASGDPRLRVREFAPLGPNPTPPTVHASLPI